MFWPNRYARRFKWQVAYSNGDVTVRLTREEAEGLAKTFKGRIRRYRDKKDD